MKLKNIIKVVLDVEVDDNTAQLNKNELESIRSYIKRTIAPLENELAGIITKDGVRKIQVKSVMTNVRHVKPRRRAS
jgi:hypothetical protein